MTKEIIALRKSEQIGFTLIELMIVIAIVSILLLVVTPNFGGFVAENRINSTQDKLVSSISLARTEAIRRGSRVAVCRANNAGTACAGASTAAGNADWSDGWLVFADDDADSSVDNGELIRVDTDLDDATTVQYSRGDMVIYNGLGMLITAAAGDEKFVIGDSTDSTLEQGLAVRSTGRIRTCVVWTASDDKCDGN